jgi:menaquinone-dependent protoporphyrinogen oxidase
VQVEPIAKNPHVDGNADYQAVLIGSAVQHGRWLPEAVEFVQANQAAFAHLPVALFSVHIRNTGDYAESRQNRLAYVDEVRALVQPVAEGFFGGRFDRRGAALLLPGLVARFVPTMDLRNWDKVHAWAESVRPLITEKV